MQSGNARILIGVPAYRGETLMRETLSCVQQQKCEDYRVIISVDNKDIKTAEACREFLNDSRFTLKIQDQHLGWAGNINWLMAQGGYEFFCFWQHDDYTSLDYLSSLLQAADANPSAVCCYSDLQWLGDEVARSACPSVTGFPLNRALYFFETMNGVPFRGLIRKRAIERAGPIRLTAYESAHEEFLWLAKLAREGNLLRVAGPLYFKRKYKDSTNAKFYLREIGWKRAVWLEYGLGALEIFWPLVLPEDREIALGVVLDRICFPGSDRLMFYDPTVERVAFAAEFLERALARFDFPGIRRAMAHSEQKDLYAGAIAGQLIDQVLSHLVFVRDLTTRAHSEAVGLDFCAGSPALSLFGYGWSAPESWGTWSEGSAASLNLPIPQGNDSYVIRFLCRAFGGVGTHCRVLVRLGEDQAVEEWLLEAGKNCEQNLIVRGPGPGNVVHFSFPDAVSPAELGASADSRRLGIGLARVEIAPMNAPSVT